MNREEVAALPVERLRQLALHGIAVTLNQLNARDILECFGEAALVQFVQIGAEAERKTKLDDDIERRGEACFNDQAET